MLEISNMNTESDKIIFFIILFSYLFLFFEYFTWIASLIEIFCFYLRYGKPLSKPAGCHGRIICFSAYKSANI